MLDIHALIAARQLGRKRAGGRQIARAHSGAVRADLSLHRLGDLAADLRRMRNRGVDRLDQLAPATGRRLGGALCRMPRSRSLRLRRRRLPPRCPGVGRHLLDARRRTRPRRQQPLAVRRLGRMERLRGAAGPPLRRRRRVHPRRHARVELGAAGIERGHEPAHVLALAMDREPSVAGDRLALAIHLGTELTEPGHVAPLLVEVAQRHLDLVERLQAADELAEHDNVRSGQQPAEQRREVLRLGHDLAVRLGHRPEAAHLVVGALVAEQPLGQRRAVLGHLVEDLAPAQHVAQGLPAGGSVAVGRRHQQRQLLERPPAQQAPLDDPRLQRGGLDTDPGAHPGSPLVLELEDRVRDGAALVDHAALDVVAQHHALQRAAVLAPAAHARRRVELERLAARQHHVDGVEDRRLAGSVVPQQEQVPAAAQIDRLIDEVVKVDQANPADPVAHGTTSPGDRAAASVASMASVASIAATASGAGSASPAPPTPKKVASARGARRRTS